MLNSLFRVTRYAGLFSGNRFYPFNPIGMKLVSKIDLEDIAHSLSNICRFNGHCAEFYSVAQHSVHVASLVQDERLRFPALLHDACEAYTGDIVTPFKRMFSALRFIEARLEAQVFEHFGVEVSDEDKALIKQADLVALATEKRDLMPRQRNEQWSYIEGLKPDPEPIHPLLPKEAKELFLDAFYTYSSQGAWRVA